LFSIDNPSHIVPAMVCDPALCKQISDKLIDRDGVYVQPINYSTVPRGTERLRITPTPHHTNADIEHLVQALTEIWVEVGLAKGGVTCPTQPVTISSSASTIRSCTVRKFRLPLADHRTGAGRFHRRDVRSRWRPCFRHAYSARGSTA
jgi:hypothetical protein